MIQAAIARVAIISFLPRYHDKRATITKQKACLALVRGDPYGNTVMTSTRTKQTTFIPTINKHCRHGRKKLSLITSLKNPPIPFII